MPSREQVHILVIDDDRTFREAVRKLLELQGYDVYDAENGELGVDMATREKPDIIICDVHMKEMHGYATVRAIKDDPRLKHIPIILITGSASRLGETRGKNAGADYYLSKPLRASELTDTISQALMNAAQRYDEENQLNRSKDLIID